jgi:hypothetical protein
LFFIIVSSLSFRALISRVWASSSSSSSCYFLLSGFLLDLFYSTLYQFLLIYLELTITISPWRFLCKRNCSESSSLEISIPEWPSSLTTYCTMSWLILPTLDNFLIISYSEIFFSWASEIWDWVLFSFVFKWLLLLLK